MKHNHFRLLLIVLFLPLLCFTQVGKIKQVRLSQFHLQSSALIKNSGKELSTENYRSKAYWFPVTVPSTVLTGLVANRVYPDPYSDLNNMLIPDASDTFNLKYGLEKYSFIPNEPNPWKKPYWYRTTFSVPSEDMGRHFELIFKGINYRAAVWLNGKQIADSSQMAGMFAEYSLDVSKLIKAGEKNILAVKIYPLDFPGEPDAEQLKAMDKFFLNGGPTGDIGKNVTMLCSVGWDWIPPVRDRNMGIWQPVYLRTTGNLNISNVQIKTDLPAENTANISLGLKLTNHSSTKQSGQLKVTITPATFTGAAINFSKEININALASSEINLTSNDVKELIVRQPRLWWPVGYGNPDLYKMKLQFVSNNIVSDDTAFLFGIRTVSSKTVDVNGWKRRDFYVNNKRVHLVGGAWVPDMMLNRDSLRYDAELRLCKNANINLVRIWGGGVTPPDVFFDLADRYGLMIWQDFWITGDTQGEFKGSPDWPIEGNVFINNIRSSVLRIRNHPSLLVWTGGNEGHARKELYDAMRNSIATLDGTRPFIPSSSGHAKLPEGWQQSWPDDAPSAVYSGGPYGWRDPLTYYKLVAQQKDWLFKDETGIPSQPPLSTLHKIIPNLTWDTTLPYPLNHTWGYHDACSRPVDYDKYYLEMEKRYGKPTDLADFSTKMQLLNAIGYQGIFESAGSKLNETGGVMLWKLNAAFPSVVWQVYDWYLQPNAGYYAMQNACEPVHIQMDLLDSSVILVNRTHKARNDLTAQVQVYDLNSTLLLNKSIPAPVLAATTVKNIFNLKDIIASAKGVSFITLSIKDAGGADISNNTYWVAPNHDYKAMQSMPKANTNFKVLSTTKKQSDIVYEVQVSNPSDKLAFFLHLSLQDETGDEIAPAFWSANYFTLAPNTSRIVTMKVPANKVNGKKCSVQLEGWNKL